MQSLRTRTSGSNCFHLTAFLSEAKLSQSVTQQKTVLWDTEHCPRPEQHSDESNPSDSFTPHTPSDKDRAHHNSHDLSPFFVGCCLHHSVLPIVSPLRATNLCALLLDTHAKNSRGLWWKAKHVLELPCTQTYLSLNIAVLCISPLSLYLASVHEQV